MNQLIKAVKEGDVDKVKELINKGVDVNTKDEDRNTALIYATDQTYSMYTYKDYITIVKLLLEAGANVNLQNNHGRTALIMATDYNNIDIVKLLIKKGADVNIQDEEGKTALMYATIMEGIKLVELLIEAGADVSLTNKEGKTVIDIAIDKANVYKPDDKLEKYYELYMNLASYLFKVYKKQYDKQISNTIIGYFNDLNL